MRFIREHSQDAVKKYRDKLTERLAEIVNVEDLDDRILAEVALLPIGLIYRKNWIDWKATSNNWKRHWKNPIPSGENWISLCKKCSGNQYHWIEKSVSEHFTGCCTIENHFGKNEGAGSKY